MFNKLAEQGISEDIIRSIKLLYSKVKLKISNNNICIDMNHGRKFNSSYVFIF